MQESAHTLIESFFRGMQIEITKLSVDIEENIYTITIETPDSPLVIGMHGLTLESIKHLLGRMLDTLSEGHVIIHLEVNDYMKQHDEKLYRYLDGRVAYAMKSGENIAVPNLSSFDRKKAHSYISEKNIEKLRTYSEGQGSDRCLHIVYEGELSSSHGTLHVTSGSRELDISEDGVGI